MAHKFGNGRLFPPPSLENYADFVYWWHWSNETFQPTITRTMAARSFRVGGFVAKIAEERFAKSLAVLDVRLASNEWLAGEEFTAAGVVVVSSLSTFQYWFPYSLAGYGNILAYLERVGMREAYRRAIGKADSGMGFGTERRVAQK